MVVVHAERSVALIRLIVDACRAAGIDEAPRICASADAMRDALDSRFCDLIIVGHHPPDVDAFACVALARSRQPESPCVVVAASDDPAFDAQCIAAGAVDCVTPGPIAPLARLFRRILEDSERRAHQERLALEAASLEAQFQQAQRLAAVGELAGGLAHDFNNLLTIINGYAEQLLRTVGPDHELRPLVEPIWRAGTSGAHLTKRLLHFGRPSSGVSAGIDLNDLVREMQPILSRLLGESVRQTLDLQDGLWRVRVASAEICQVLMNLATNARDAMPAGGLLTITTANVALPEGAFVDLIVRDTGSGMSDDVRAHLFEPFFTTKTQGNGTGLGLASISAIVHAHRGQVHVDTEVGRGTVMRVRLPRDPGEELPAHQPVEDEASTSAGGALVLLVEDDAGVREIIARFLRGGGYDVVEASDAEQAESIVRAGGRRINALVSDVVLPGDSGPLLAAKLGTLVPGLRTLFISGYPAEAIAQFGPESGLTFLVKPFSRATLLRRLRETMLDDAGGGV